MELQDKHIIWLAFLLLLVTSLTLYNIFSFMPVNKRCQDAFTIINKCSCIPDDGLAKLFNTNASVYLPNSLNITIPWK